MPAYPGPGLAAPLDYNRQGILWGSETPPAGTFPGSLSTAFLLQRVDNQFYPWGASFELYFNASPGSFEVDIVGANTDAPGSYVLLGSITQASATSIIGGTNYVYRYDMASNLWPKYVAAWMKSIGNAVLVTLTVTR